MRTTVAGLIVPLLLMAGPLAAQPANDAAAPSAVPWLIAFSDAKLSAGHLLRIRSVTARSDGRVQWQQTDHERGINGQGSPRSCAGTDQLTGEALDVVRAAKDAIAAYAPARSAATPDAQAARLTLVERTGTASASAAPSQTVAVQTAVASRASGVTTKDAYVVPGSSSSGDPRLVRAYALLSRYGCASG